ncbi:MAG TPA: hypothetical protein VNE00_21590 [Paraburkholderia sp.]|nr:hypothetical protein [Paraburkholderia sp.]
MERTTTQTTYGPDGSVTQSTTTERSGRAGMHGQGALCEGGMARCFGPDFAQAGSLGFGMANGGAFSSGAFSHFSASSVSMQSGGIFSSISAGFRNLLGGMQFA